MEIIILGVILFVIAVGATIVYDNYKTKIAFMEKLGDAQAATKQWYEDGLNKIKAQVVPAKKGPFTQNSTDEEFLVKFRDHMTPKKKSQEEVISELLRERNQNQTQQVNVRRTIKPGSIVAGLIKEGDMPTETQYVEELFNDVSINSTLTVQELIAKIERLKNRPGPKR